MLPTIMITEGGPHSAEAWAGVTAQQIIQVGETASGIPGAQARKLELRVIEILEAAHAHVQEHEQAALSEHGADRYDHPLDSGVHIDDPLAEIVAASQGTAYEAHFAKAEVQAYIRQVLGEHFATSMKIERDWHADRAVAA